MGGVVSSLFGGGQNYEAPDYTPTTMPTYEQAGEPEAKSARDEYQRRIKAKRAGLNGTLLTQTLGTSNASGLLGRSLTQ